ncbi:MAG TPA: phage tail protein [Ilumatobacteraceae bacterium]|nr:phage tail protein [Ilumatobacteraceae bacterium]HRB02091.1 phage tail protein [Ilumatobacteraceae bacterium]
MPSTEKYEDFQGSFFGLEIDAVKLGFFTACSGISIEFDVVSHKTAQSGGKHIERKIPGRPKYGEIVMKRGYSTNKDLYDWFDSVVIAKKFERKTAAIVVYDRTGEEVARFNIDKCWPSKLGSSDLSAKSDDVVIEEVTLQHELLTWK